MMHTRVRSAALKYAAVGIGLLLALSHSDVAAQQTRRVPAHHLTAGRSTVLTTDFDIVRLAITDPAIADGLVVAPREVLVDGKAAGTVSLILWGGQQLTPAIRRRRRSGRVRPPAADADPLPHRTSKWLNGDAVILSAVSRCPRCRCALPKSPGRSRPSRILNLLQVPGGPAASRCCQVRFAEVSRALMELGVSLFTSPTGIESTIGRVTTGQFSAPTFPGLEWRRPAITSVPRSSRRSVHIHRLSQRIPAQRWPGG